MKNYIEENENFNYSHKNIQDIVNDIDLNNDEETDLVKYSIKAYNHIRDRWVYNPHRLSFRAEDWRASNIAQIPSGNCLDKAVLFISVLRAKNIPARLGLAKVKNHIAVEDIIEKFGNDVLVPHGYVELYLNHKWIKATPAFNKTLCEKLNVETLEFDGQNDSLFQPFDNTGEVKFMEYIEDYGTFNHVPLSYMLDLLRETYPDFKRSNITLGMCLNLGRLE